MEIELEVTASVAIQRKKPWSRFAWLKEVAMQSHQPTAQAVSWNNNYYVTVICFAIDRLSIYGFAHVGCTHICSWLLQWRRMFTPCAGPWQCCVQWAVSAGQHPDQPTLPGHRQDQTQLPDSGQRAVRTGTHLYISLGQCAGRAHAAGSLVCVAAAVSPPHHLHHPALRPSLHPSLCTLTAA